MVPAIALWFALVSPQATTPTLPLPTEPPAEPGPKPCGLDATGKYHVGCGVSAPRLTHQVEPQFSAEARRTKTSGIVLVGLTLDEQGKPTNVHVVRSAAASVDEKHRAAAATLDDKALAAVMQYKFAPATYQGQPVPVELKIEVNFRVFSNWKEAKAAGALRP